MSKRAAAAIAGTVYLGLAITHLPWQAGIGALRQAREGLDGSLERMMDDLTTAYEEFDDAYVATDDRS